MPRDQDVRILHGLGDARLFRARDEVVEQHPELALAARLKLLDHRLQIVSTVHRFDDDAEIAKIVAPHMLEEFGVMFTFDPDTACASNTSPSVTGTRP